MADRDDVKRTASDPRYSHARFGWVALLLSIILLALQMGCREESANVQGPSTQTEPAKVIEAEAETASEGAQIAETVAVKSPKIVLEKTTHDFGEIGPGTAQSTKFKFKNEGTTPLKDQPGPQLLRRGYERGQGRPRLYPVPLWCSVT